METEITGSDQDQGIGVEVYDENENRHWIVVMWDGSVRGHETDDYPHDPADRTLEEQKIMTQTANRARLAAQREFPDADILSPNWNPDQLQRAVLALQRMPVDEFADAFEDFYHYLTDPESATGITRDEALLVYQDVFVDEDDRVAEVIHPHIEYVPKGEDNRRTTEVHPDFEALDDDPDLTTFMAIMQPVTFKRDAYEFPDGFQVFLIKHFGAKIHDAFRHVGEDPPEPYDWKEVRGQIVTAADDEFYDEFVEATQ